MAGSNKKGYLRIRNSGGALARSAPQDVDDSSSDRHRRADNCHYLDKKMAVAPWQRPHRQGWRQLRRLHNSEEPTEMETDEELEGQRRSRSHTRKEDGH